MLLWSDASGTIPLLALVLKFCSLMQASPFRDWFLLVCSAQDHSCGLAFPLKCFIAHRKSLNFSVPSSCFHLLVILYFPFLLVLFISFWSVPKQQQISLLNSFSASFGSVSSIPLFHLLFLFKEMSMVFEPLCDSNLFSVYLPSFQSISNDTQIEFWNFDVLSWT